MITEKTCKQCNETKQVRSFHKKADNADGYYPLCKECRRSNSGHTKREPVVRDTRTDVTYEDLIEDVFAMERRKPTDLKLRKAADELRNRPQGCYSDYTNDLIYHCWQDRQAHVIESSPTLLDSPVLSQSTQRHIEEREFTNMFE